MASKSARNKLPPDVAADLRVVAARAIDPTPAEADVLGFRLAGELPERDKEWLAEIGDRGDEEAADRLLADFGPGERVEIIADWRRKRRSYDPARRPGESPAAWRTRALRAQRGPAPLYERNPNTGALEYVCDLKHVPDAVRERVLYPSGNASPAELRARLGKWALSRPQTSTGASRPRASRRRTHRRTSRGSPSDDDGGGDGEPPPDADLDTESAAARRERDHKLVRRLLELGGGAEWADAFRELAALRGVRFIEPGAPTVSDLARELGLSKSTAYRRLQQARERA